MKKNLFTLILIGYALCSFAQDQIATLLNREAAYQRLSGTALVVKDGETLLSQSYGYADFNNKAKNELETPFDIGSVSKQFTAAGILTLVNDHKIALQDPINQYLGVYASKKWKKITIHHLLTHTSGIPSLFQGGEGTDDLFPKADAIDVQTLVNSVSNRKLKFKPGKQYSYSNTGYLLLALIIEKVSGQPYEDYLQEQVFDKYGLAHTSFGPKGTNYAKPHFNYHTDMTEEGVVFHKNWMLGAGGIYSTPSDLYKWVKTIQSEYFLSEDLRNSFLTGHIKTRRGMYAYGWDVIKSKQGTIISHDGTNMGYVSYCGYNPENGDAVIITTNQTYPTFETVGKSQDYLTTMVEKLWTALNGESIDVLPELAETQPAVGSYTFQDGYQVSISHEENQWYVNGMGDYSPVRMVFQHELNANDTLSSRVVKMAEAFGTRKFKTIREICDKQMQFAVKTGIIKLGFGLITSHLGDINTITPYYATSGLGKVRLIGSNGIMDIDIYFNKNNEVQGIFQGGSYTTESPKKLKLYGIEGGQFYVDGFPFGEKDAIITINDNELVLKQLGRAFKARGYQSIVDIR